MIDYSIIGKRFGRLTVLSLDHITERHNMINNYYKKYSFGILNFQCLNA